MLTDFVECTKGRLFSVAWACREQNTKLFNCLKDQCVLY